MTVDFGSMIRPDVIPGHALERNMAALDAARAPMRVCEHYTHPRNGLHIQVMAAGGYSGDPLDDSNAATLEEMGRAWIDDERNGDANDVDNVTVDWHPMNGNGSSATVVCVNASVVDGELLAEIIAAAEAFAEYPVLDESDWSQRELDGWNEAVEWEARDIPEHLRSRFAELIGEHFGESDPGHIADEWVLDAMRELGLIGRRVRLEGTRQWHARTPMIMARDVDMEWSWRRLERIY